MVKCMEYTGNMGSSATGMTASGIADNFRELWVYCVVGPTKVVQLKQDADVQPAAIHCPAGWGTGNTGVIVSSVQNGQGMARLRGNDRQPVAVTLSLGYFAIFLMRLF